MYSDNPLAWFFGRGLRSMLANALVPARFVFHRFGVIRHLKTLISPWKRDVHMRDYRGVHPLLFLRRVADNVFSRVMGALVRSVMIAAGALGTVGALLLGVLLLVLYLCGPFFFLVGALLMMVALPGAELLALSGFLGLGLVFFGYLFRERPVVALDDFAAVRREPWFRRVLNRLGLEQGEIPNDTLYSERNFFAELAAHGIEREFYDLAVKIEQAAALRLERKRRFWLPENYLRIPPVGEGWRYAYTPKLDRYVVDLSRGDPTLYRGMELIGRQAELKVAQIVLERPVQNSIFLVGEPGIGKRLFAHHMAALARTNAFPKGSRLNDLRFLVFDLGEAVGDAVSRKMDVDDYIRVFLTEAAYAGNVVLIIQDIDLFLGADKDKPNIAHVLNDYLALPHFRVIGTAVAHRYHIIAKLDESILKSFETIYLRQPDMDENRDILLQCYEQTERKQVVFTLKGIEQLIRASRQFNWEMPYPERVLDLAQQILVMYRDSPERFVDEHLVDRYIALKTGMPTGAVGEAERERLLHLEDILHERIVGQNEAVNQVAHILRRARAGFHDPKKPLGTFLFMGPTGVGKTETVKALAETVFGDEEKMIRFDMSEYQQQQAVETLLGSQARGEPGKLSQVMKEHPYAIILLDEVEKAYPKLLDLFLQVLDEGVITDNFGEKVNFRNAVIIATSNAGSALIRDLAAQKIPVNVMRTQVLDHVVRDGVFRIEFLNRFDNIIFFEPLSATQLETVVVRKLAEMAEHAQRDNNITVSFADGVTAKVVELGYEPEFGARSINRFILDKIENIIVRRVLSGALKSGGSITITPADIDELSKK